MGSNPKCWVLDELAKSELGLPFIGNDPKKQLFIALKHRDMGILYDLV